MTPEELLKLRYKVIAQYPFSPHPNGEILRATSGDTYFNQYPHLFKKLEWWEDRTREEMPEYFKISDGLGTLLKDEKKRIYKIGLDANWNFYKEHVIGVKYKPGGGTMIDYVIPATEQEYREYTKQKEG